MTDNVFFAAHRFGQEQHTASSPLEQAFLATCLLTPKALELLPEGFGGHHLQCEGHADIFDAIKVAAARGVPVLLPLVKSAVPRFGAPGGYIDDLIKAYEIADLRGFRGYAEAIMEDATRRDLIALADAIKRDATDQNNASLPVAAIMTKAAVEFDRLAAGQKQGRKAVSIAEAVDDAIEAGEAAALRGDGLAGISSGFRGIDRRLSGFEPETMNILAGRPGMGKTALAVPIAIHVARTSGPVLFGSLEMASRQIGRRALSAISGVPVGSLKSGAFTRDDKAMAAVVEARRTLSELPLSIEDEPALTVDAIRHRIKAATRRMGELALVVIDHLHLVGRPETAAKHGDTHAITEISRGSKRLAKEFGLPVLLLAQLNRGVEGRDDKRPNLSDLRQSGAIEEDADSVMMLYREEYYAKKAGIERRPGDNEEKYYQRALDHRSHLESVAGRAELLFEKSREGETGIEPLRFEGSQMLFYEDPEERPPVQWGGQA